MMKQLRIRFQCNIFGYYLSFVFLYFKWIYILTVLGKNNILVLFFIYYLYRLNSRVKDVEFIFKISDKTYQDVYNKTITIFLK